MHIIYHLYSIVLNKEKSETVYLVNNNWIEKYKSFYEYNDLKDYLKQLNKVDKLYTTSFDIITKDYIYKIISNLPMNYINKLKDKNKFESTEKIDKYETDIIKGTQVGQNIQISYLINNQIINQKIYTSLINREYGKNSQLKNSELYFIDNQKVLLFYNQSLNKDKDAIGFINEQNIFIPEYILDYNDIKLPQLSHFLHNNFQSFCLDTQKGSCHIYDANNSKIGKCYRVNKASNEVKVHKSNNLNQSQNNNNIPLDKDQKEIQKYIELFFQIYLFHEKMKNRIKQSLINSKIEHYYIMKKKWMNKFLEYLEYNKFIEYLNKGNIGDIINKYKNNNPDYIVEIKNLLRDSYIKKVKERVEDKNEFNKIKKSEYELKQKNRTFPH